ncbi:MazG nucleotide pyrophosphohydrolase domain-containing protein [Actinomadura sp. CNU-125]|uniref:MazG nucleotide pyrophosphohydrolase domain-containing protein n=1 Tax=Actinomadura sp. CNU-125 TaxID=1904961 RepID=UPI002915E94C|nr:MazG nucleotide pyrophosphohydrolase domain-containing protein [Actinomadura sp. CNU-125]
MDTLRRECPWDREQTHESLVPYLLEESYEVLDTVESGDLGALREELGDVLMQVAFHSVVPPSGPTAPSSRSTTSPRGSSTSSSGGTRTCSPTSR